MNIDPLQVLRELDAFVERQINWSVQRIEVPGRHLGVELFSAFIDDWSLDLRDFLFFGHLLKLLVNLLLCFLR